MIFKFQGSVLIRMMENFLTKKTFRQGLANYFKVISKLCEGFIF